MPKAFCVERNKSESVKLSKGGPVIIYRHVYLATLSEYNTSARHEGLKRKMFGMSDGGDVGRLQ